ncbi:MAG TPA: ABC transporter permease [Thermomicrobiales bacterium]|nr:ABC transporter permease [Thermomicrobiales bacterium]
MTERQIRRPDSLRRRFWRRFTSNALAVTGLVVVIAAILTAILGPYLVTADPNKIDYAAINAGPAGKHPLGTDDLGRDTLARLVYGLRVSLLVAAYAELLDILVGVPLGLAAGYLGGKVDFAITRIADVLFAFPGLLLAILVAAIFGSAVTERFGGMGRLALVAGALSLVSWPLMSRLVRSQTLAIREQDYVLAAQSLGANRPRILRRHVVPQLVGLVVTTVTLNVSGVVINEAVLSLLGLGIQPPDSSIGKMISDAMPYLESNTLQVAIPSALLMTIVLAVSFLGDGLRDAFAADSRI